ncbi:TetR/AcrR family transcriptional regulator [Dokdonella sp.]|uniref:TetR/AcrR family transcriptional regulator n=1 Tax=Dokdonella sp. TaxID=2291710 RepID=UPI001B214DD2|nr:TetR/AcrR family transcriptional regulator [Dokdonella sp.]MBO9662312.1 TetR/AcrR family transcriptional regulator [Dokdonella sp.]
MPTRKNPSGRAPGRPARTRGDERRRLLDVALALFAKRGIAATPLAAIARRGRVTPALLHYYFGSRDRLLDALMDERVLPLLEPVRADLLAQAHDPARQIETLVRSLFRVLEANPWLPPLWLREVLTEGGLLRERLLRGVASRIAPLLRDAIAAAQASGQINRDLDPRLTVVSLIGLTVFPFAARPIWTRLLDADDVDAGRLATHTLALLGRGLELEHA